MRFQLKSNMIIPLFLSFLFSGLGQIAKKQYLKGVNFILFQILFILLLLSEEPLFFKFGIIGLPIFWVVNLLDAGEILTYDVIFLSEWREKFLFLTSGVILIIITIFLFTLVMWEYRPKAIEDFSTSEYPKAGEPHSSQPKYLISLGVFEIPRNATETNEEFRNLGYPTRILSLNGKQMVCIYGLEDLEEAKRRAVELSDKGLDCYVASSESPTIPIFIKEGKN